MFGLLSSAGVRIRIRRLGRAVYWRLPVHGRDAVVELAYRHAGFLFRGMGRYEAWRQRGANGHEWPDMVGGAGLVALADVRPLTEAPGRIAIHAHMFYAELAGEFADRLRNMPFDFHLFVSVGDRRGEAACRKAFERLPRVAGLQIAVVPNRGRDIAPMFCIFGQALRDFDFVAHIHSKKSLYNRGATDGWRDYLLGSLLGSDDRLRRIFGLLKAGAGMVFPQTYSNVPYVAGTWLANRATGAAWCHRLGIARMPRGYFDFPVGSMFWARTETLLPLFDSGVELAEFEEEIGQTDGTLAHAIERLLGVVARSSGRPLAILRDELNPSWSAWRFEQFVLRGRDAATAAVSAPELQLVVFDIFDTLLLRPLTDPEQAKRIVAHRAGGDLGERYLRWRAEAENAARARAGRDVGLPEIIAEMAGLAVLGEREASELLNLEQEVELALVSPREDFVRLLGDALRAGKRVVLASDMYLPRARVELMLRRCGVQGWHGLYVSSEVGLRKDSGALYDHILATEAVTAAEVLVVGDNERSDFQIPADRGMRTLHVLRPVELARAMPRLVSLVEDVEDAGELHGDIALGLILRRHFSGGVFGRFDPACLIPSPSAHALGYAVAGPLALSFVQWLIARAQADSVERLFFLAREGQFLLEVFQRFAATLDSAPSASYLVLSRRAVNVSAIGSMDDMLAIARTYYGPHALTEYLLERFGLELGEADLQPLYDRGLWRKGRKVEIRDDHIEDLRPLLEALLPQVLTRAEHERAPLMAYLEACGLSAKERCAVVDIGYSGTIQRRLNALLGSGIDGYYMATDERAAGVAQTYGVTARGCFHDGAKHGAAGPPLIAQSFIAEKLFSSDDAQVVKYVYDTDGSAVPLYRPLSSAELATRPVRSEIRAGALAYVEDALQARAVLMPDFAVPPELALRLFEAFVERMGDAERAVINDLILDDHYCGRGLVA